jgi:hypothetical protein
MIMACTLASEVLKAVILKSIVFWNGTLCNSEEVRCFEETYHSLPSSACFLLGLLLSLEYVPLKHLILSVSSFWYTFPASC